jgi:hypothetical protein
MPSTYEPIATTTLSSAQSNVTFSNISGSYTDLILICSAQGTNGTDLLNIILNNDTSSNYSWTRIKGNGSVVDSARLSNQSLLSIGDWMPNSAYFFPVIVQIQNYSNSTTYKSILSRYNAPTDAVVGVVGLWRSTSAITTIRLQEAGGSINLKAGSTFTLYGIAAA